MKIFKISSLALVVFWTLAGLVTAQELPKPVGFVNDFANVIPQSAQQDMTSICQELKQKTGAEIAVVTMTSIRDEDYRDYANRLFSEWKIGERGKDNGVLVFNAVNERKIWIEVGYGLEEALPDGLAGEIRDRYFIPHLKKGDYGSAHLTGTTAIASVIAKYYGVSLNGEMNVPDSGGASGKRVSKFPKLFGLLFFIFLIIVTRGRIIPWLLLGSMMGGGSRRSGHWGGSSGGGFGGGFGGFGGGMSGGGGAGGSY
ncbi:MAG: TPM domain-containing protein [Candidatus Zhuqueibacterota bacterium]